MNHRIITDESRLQAFIDWLPELEPGEVFFVALFARKKYAPDSGLKSDKGQLARLVTTKSRLRDRLRQLECPIGAYVRDQIVAPQESLVVYINPNPRSLEKAAKSSLIHLAELITKPYGGYDPHEEVLSEIQKSASRKIFVDFDFDAVELAPVLEKIRAAVNADATRILRTRGGFHVLIEPAKVDAAHASTWYRTICELPGCDVRGDHLMPIPGCTQGGFTPEWVTA